MESKEQLRKIAIYCDEYDSRIDHLRSSHDSDNESDGSFESCINCTHYGDYKCELDLIDKVLSSMAMDLDLK